jgi:hypothetical protein
VKDSRFSILHTTEAIASLTTRVVQVERDQKADAARIEDAIRQAESDMAALARRHIAPEELKRHLIMRRDRAVLTVRHVRKNMIERTVAAEGMQRRLRGSRRSRFHENDEVDASLRTRFFELVRRIPTSSLVEHFGEAIEARNIACADILEFEFLCRDDKHEYLRNFEEIVRISSPPHEIELRKRLANIRIAVEEVDAKITDLLKRATQYLEEIKVIGGVVVIDKHPRRDAFAG